MKLHHRQDVIVRLVERVQDFVARNRDRLRSTHPPLDLDKPQLAGRWHAAFNVVAQLLKLAINRIEAQTLLHFHHRCPSARRTGLRFHRHAWRLDHTNTHLGDQSDRHDQEAAQHYWRQWGDLRFELQLCQALFQACLQSVGALARFARVQPGIGTAGLLVQLEFLGAVIPVDDLLGQAVFDGRFGLAISSSRLWRTSPRCSGTTCATA